MILLTEQNFDNTISQGTILVDFYADWCGPCRALTPLLERLSQQFTVAKIDVSATPALAQRFGVSSIPTLIVFKDGQEFKRTVGLQSEAALVALMS